MRSFVWASVRIIINHSYSTSDMLPHDRWCYRFLSIPWAFRVSVHSPFSWWTGFQYPIAVEVLMDQCWFSPTLNRTTLPTSVSQTASTIFCLSSVPDSFQPSPQETWSSSVRLLLLVFVLYVYILLPVSHDYSCIGPRQGCPPTRVFGWTTECYRPRHRWVDSWAAGSSHYDIKPLCWCSTEFPLFFKMWLSIHIVFH